MGILLLTFEQSLKMHIQIKEYDIDNHTSVGMPNSSILVKSDSVFIAKSQSRFPHFKCIMLMHTMGIYHG